MLFSIFIKVLWRYYLLGCKGHMNIVCFSFLPSHHKNQSLKKHRKVLSCGKENSYHMDWMWIGYQRIAITYPIQVGHERKQLPKKAFLFPISYHIPGKQQLRNNHNFGGTKKDELLEHCASIKTLILNAYPQNFFFFNTELADSIQ